MADSTELPPPADDPDSRSLGRSTGDIVQMFFSAVVTVGLIACASIFVGLIALSLKTPMLSTVVVVALYGGVIWAAIAALRGDRRGPILTGFLVGSIIGCLVCGLCSTMMAVNSSSGLNLH